MNATLTLRRSEAVDQLDWDRLRITPQNLVNNLDLRQPNLLPLKYYPHVPGCSAGHNHIRSFIVHIDNDSS